MQSKDTSSGGTGDSNSASSSIPIQRLLDLAGKVIAPVTILTALLFYFGWTRTQTLYLRFGIDQSMLGFSTSDYVLRSLVVTFEPLRWILLFGLLGPWVHFAVRRFLQREPPPWVSLDQKHVRLSRLLVRGVLTMGFLSLLAMVAGVFLDIHQWLHPVFFPITWTLGVGLIGYGIYLRTQLRQKTLRRLVTSRGIYRTTWFFAAALVVLGLFWAVGYYADEVGEWGARQLVSRLVEQPSVIVYSQNQLSLNYNGIEEQEVNTTEKSYRYRYSGLKFLTHANDKYFLLPDRWSASDPVTIIIPENDTIRVEMMPGVSSTP